MRICIERAFPRVRMGAAIALELALKMQGSKPPLCNDGSRNCRRDRHLFPFVLEVQKAADKSTLLPWQSVASWLTGDEEQLSTVRTLVGKGREMMGLFLQSLPTRTELRSPLSSMDSRLNCAPSTWVSSLPPLWAH